MGKHRITPRNSFDCDLCRRPPWPSLTGAILTGRPIFNVETRWVSLFINTVLLYVSAGARLKFMSEEYYCGPNVRPAVSALRSRVTPLMSCIGVTCKTKRGALQYQLLAASGCYDQWIHWDRLIGIWRGISRENESFYSNHLYTLLLVSKCMTRNAHHCMTVYVVYHRVHCSIVV